MIGFSTAWLPEIGWPIDQALDLLAQFGSRPLEFNYRVHPVDIPMTRIALDKHGMSVVSLHNVCSSQPEPIPHEDRFGDSVAALDENERRQGAQRLRATAETARALGARAVVVHGGAVVTLKHSPIYKRALRQTERWRDASILKSVLPELMAERARVAPQHLQQLVKTLSEVCPDFPDLRFGLEVRFHFHSLPSFDELEGVLATLKLSNVGYWHDCGHGQVQENLGLARHEAWLERYGHVLIGVHLHGLQYVVRDHRAPRHNDMNFRMVRRHIRPDTILIAEIAPDVPAEDVVAGLKYLDSFFGPQAG